MISRGFVHEHFEMNNCRAILITPSDINERSRWIMASLMIGQLQLLQDEEHTEHTAGVV